MRNPKLNDSNFKVQLGYGGESPLRHSMLISGPDKKCVAAINFTLVHGAEGPGVIIGNVQGGQKEHWAAFTEKVGETPLAFAVNSFLRAFPNPERVRALNPRHHYYNQPNLFALSNSMRMRGVLNVDNGVLRGTQALLAEPSLKDNAKALLIVAYLEELGINLASQKGLKAATQIEETAERVRIEAAALKTRLRGMHTAAYVHAGFKREPKEKYWRLKPRGE
ncbi:TPA: hypothetical protein HA318_02845 [Candidatus Micrarchaeota archaeon]|nr:hypothetical protein [Candidatus Micrarchaeota archaeon]